MPFSCAGLVSHLRKPENNDSESNDTEHKGIKRSCPSPINTSDHNLDSIHPEIPDILDDILNSLSNTNISEKQETEDISVVDVKNNTSVVPAASEENTDVANDVQIVDEYLNGNELESKDSIFDFENTPLQVTGCWNEFKNKAGDNYTRGCKWAPDGTCLVTCSNDNILRLFNLPSELWDTSQWQDIPEMESVVKIKEGGLVYDFCWYPLMNSADPSSCCLASCSKINSVHLWDGFTGELRCSYRAYDQMDEVTAPHSISFDADGQRLYCGFEKVVRIFNVNLPGREFQARPTFAKKSGQSGIISCFAFTSANKNISAAGSFQKTIGIYSEPDGDLQALVAGQQGGVTQVQFSPDGTLLYSGGRKDPEILCWDMRNLGTVLYSLRRSCKTNQRMQFDISSCGRYVVSGNHNGVISVWDTFQSPKEISLDDYLVLEPTQIFLAHNDCVNGISLHPTSPLLCSTSGQRHFPELLQDDEDSMFSPEIKNYDNSLRLWWVGKC